MLSQIVSVTRLRQYEKECRRLAEAEPNTTLRGDLVKFADTLRGAVRELETTLDVFTYDGAPDASLGNGNPNWDM